MIIALSIGYRKNNNEKLILSYSSSESQGGGLPFEIPTLIPAPEVST